MPEAPESVLIDLRAVRDTFELRWNPTAVRVKPGYYSSDPDVGFVAPEFDPRWELWDVDTDGRSYKLLTLKDPDDGSFRPPGQWLVNFIRLINPERWGGDANKMIEALVDRPNELRDNVAEEDFDDLAAQVGKFAGWIIKPKSRILADTKSGRWSAAEGT